MALSADALRRLAWYDRLDASPLTGSVDLTEVEVDELIELFPTELTREQILRLAVTGELRALGLPIRLAARTVA